MFRDELVAAARQFKSFAAELYIRRLLGSIGVSWADVSEKHIPALCEAAERGRADEFNQAGLDAFLKRLRDLDKGPGNRT